MKNSNPFQFSEYTQEKPIMHPGIGRRLPPTPLSSQILYLSQTVPPTANSSPQVKKFMNIPSHGAHSYDDNFLINRFTQSNSSSRRMLFDETKLDQPRIHNSTPLIAA
ncbi:unnamed protein product [Cercopithifilaria johnstoni]|uniref:Uncharacterized protein n=1 Tax=Cercopithifilaria johnstoni TaxID=2874296 RepID=A0A8J2LXD7_9BILA|nr:unnamed protein product [Cercopithifilaria johnstoni]